MDNNEIFVPKLSWLIGGSRIGGGYNYYTGSRGTDSMKGYQGNTIFNYRVWLEKIDEHEIIKASVYFGPVSFECQSEDDVEITTYELEEESRELIGKWITEKYDAYLRENA